jgi:spore germination cell wall hydrolase CwlJ-like protein
MKHLFILAVTAISLLANAAEEYYTQTYATYYTTAYNTQQHDDITFDLLDSYYILTPELNPYSWSDSEKHCLALNIYHEAALEPVEGQVAVAVVTLNRVHDPEYPNTICQVVYQRGQITIRPKHTSFVTKPQTKIVCQFSWTCQRVRPPQPNYTVWQNILQLVDDIQQRKYADLETKYKPSFHYHAYYVNPGWRIPRLWQTGAHIFYTR